MALVLRQYRTIFSRLLKETECKYVTGNVYSMNVLKYSNNYHGSSEKTQIVYNTQKNYGLACLDHLRTYCNQTNEPSKPPSVFQRFKSMYKDYWYVLIPVHVVTSIGWFGGFYYMARSGIDIVGLMEALNISEKLIESMKSSKMGYFAVAYACYKIATPVRYTVTLGGATISINYLKKWGYIKPVLSPQRLKQIYEEKILKLDKTVRDKKEDIIAKKEEFLSKKEKIKNHLDDKLEKGIQNLEKLKDSATKEILKKK